MVLCFLHGEGEVVSEVVGEEEDARFPYGLWLTSAQETSLNVTRAANSHRPTLRFAAPFLQRSDRWACRIAGGPFVMGWARRMNSQIARGPVLGEGKMGIQVLYLDTVV